MTYKTLEDYKDQIPEGATHYINESCDDHFAFYRVVGGKVEISVPFRNLIWIKSDYDSLDEIENIIALTPEKKTEWNGEGYPPVGVECEIATNGYDDWSKCFVKFVGDDICVVGFNGCEESRILRLVKFRPLETPEQKKEREELEAAYDLYKTFYPLSCITLEEFVGSDIEPKWIEIVRKTNYKLEKPQ